MRKENQQKKTTMFWKGRGDSFSVQSFVLPRLGLQLGWEPWVIRDLTTGTRKIYHIISNTIQKDLNSNSGLLVFLGKDLCEARVKPEMSSNLADEPSLADIPPPDWDCHLQMFTDWVINVCSESPFESQKWVQIWQMNLLWLMSPPFTSHLQQITDWVINVCSEGHFKTVRQWTP